VPHELHVASFVFARFLGFLDDTRNDDEIESGASWRGVVEHVSASSGEDTNLVKTPTRSRALATQG
jgi:hypothetical protein